MLKLHYDGVDPVENSIKSIRPIYQDRSLTSLYKPHMLKSPNLWLRDKTKTWSNQERGGFFPIAYSYSFFDHARKSLDFTNGSTERSQQRNNTITKRAMQTQRPSLPQSCYNTNSKDSGRENRSTKRWNALLKMTQKLGSHYRVLPLRVSVFVRDLALHLKKKKVKAILMAKIL